MATVVMEVMDKVREPGRRMMMANLECPTRMRSRCQHIKPLVCPISIFFSLSAAAVSRDYDTASVLTLLPIHYASAQLNYNRCKLK